MVIITTFGRWDATVILNNRIITVILHERKLTTNDFCHDYTSMLGVYILMSSLKSYQ